MEKKDAKIITKLEHVNVYHTKNIVFTNQFSTRQELMVLDTNLILTERIVANGKIYSLID